ncbi:MAG: acyl-CoA desaturase [Planctomycetota bacterium]
MTNSASVAARPPRRGISWRQVDWPVAIAMLLMHVGCIFAFFFFSWSGLVVALFLSWVTGPIGISLCFHRLLTHRSFKTPKWFEYLLTCCGCLACQGGPVQWIGVHRIHHKHSDDHGDPHSPKHGFTWSHILWCLRKHQGLAGSWVPADAARDLCRDKGTRLINKYYLVPQLVVTVLCFLGGTWAARLGLETSGLSWVLWGVGVRTTVVFHSTWFVNSASHTWGYQNYKTGDGSTNCWWVALLSMGEWHNNHHAEQRSARYGGRRWFEFDPTWWTLHVLKRLGLASDFIYPRTLDSTVSSPLAGDAVAEE